MKNDETDTTRDKDQLEPRDDRDRQDIARRAYERYQARGAAHGRDQEDWFEAERESNEKQSE